MWFSAKDKNSLGDKHIPISGLMILDDLSLYHQFITFTINTRIYAEKGVIDFESYRINVRVISQTLIEGNVFKTDCITEDVYNVLNNVCEGYNGFTTINGLFAKLGLSYYSEYKSNNCYYSIPRCKISSLLDKLTMYGSFANGGGAHFYINANGVIIGYDYKLINDKCKPKVLLGEISKESTDDKWNLFSAAEYDMMVWDNTNSFKKESFVIEKGYGKSVISVNDTTGLYKDVLKQELTNSFYNKFFSSRQIVVDVLGGNNGAVKLGELVNLNNWNDLLIVKAITVNYEDTSEKGNISMTLISKPVFAL